MRPSQEYGLDLKFKKKSVLYHCFQQGLCRNEYKKMVLFTSQYSKSPVQQQAVGFSFIYSCKDWGICNTSLGLFFLTPCAACGNGLDWWQKCAEQPAPWPKASQLASSPVTRSHASGKWCSCKKCWGQLLKSVLCWVLKYRNTLGPRQKLPRQIEVRTF